MEATVAFDGMSPADVADALRSLESELTDALEAAMEDIGARIRGAAADEAPVDTGRLQNSLEAVVESVGATLTRVKVGSNLEYAKAQEYGTDAFFPPPSELRAWAGRVLGDESLAYPVARSIATTGIDEQPYLGPAFDENLTWAVDRINDAVDDAIASAGLA